MNGASLSSPRPDRPVTLMFGTPQYRGLSDGMLIPSALTTFSLLARGEMWPFFRYPNPRRASFSLFEPSVRVLLNTSWCTSVFVLIPMSGMGKGSYPRSRDQLWRSVQLDALRVKSTRYVN